VLVGVTLGVAMGHTGALNRLILRSSRNFDVVSLSTRLFLGVSGLRKFIGRGLVVKGLAGFGI
jgi:hypothetical protein